MLKNIDNNTDNNSNKYLSLEIFSEVDKIPYIKNEDEKIYKDYPITEKYKDRLNNFLSGESNEISLSYTSINDKELKKLFKELKNYK